MKATTVLLFFSIVICFPSNAIAVVFDWVTVGNPGNAADELSTFNNPNNLQFGAVDYTYRISSHEVTNSQYTEFLNQVAASDPYSLWDNRFEDLPFGGIVRNGSPGSYTYSVKADAVGEGPGGTDYTFGDKPVLFVSWYDAVRFVNWLQNGQGSGDTETGAYTLGPVGEWGIPLDGSSITRNAGATWALPNENEWYKAAYHKNDGITGNYWTYPTTTNDMPNNNLPVGDTGNSANFFQAAGTIFYPLTDVGAYSLSTSPYGTYDQGGNVSEWVENLYDTSSRVIRGGDWKHNHFGLISWVRLGIDPGTFEVFHHKGFRVINVPEPRSMLLVMLASFFCVRSTWGRCNRNS